MIDRLTGPLICGQRYLLLLVLSIAAGCGKHDAGSSGKAHNDVPPSQVKLARPVEVAAVERKDLTYTVDTVGTLEPLRQTAIASGVPGVVDKVLFQEGDLVDPETTVLVHIDQRKYRAALLLAKANQARAQSRLVLAQDLADRTERLFARKAIAEEEAIQRQSELKAAKSELEAATATHEMVETEMTKTQVRPPYAGQINERRVAPGDYVKEESVIATIADVSTLRLVTYIPEMAAARIKSGDVVDFELPALSSRKFQAKIFYLSTVADPQTHMFQCKAEIPNPDKEMKPGLFARVQLTTEQHPGAMVVPEESIRASEQGFVVFIPEEKPGADGKTHWVARQRVVQLGFRRPGSVEVLSGVEAGQRVVTRGSESLENGTPIEFTPAANPVTATASAQLEKP